MRSLGRRRRAPQGSDGRDVGEELERIDDQLAAIAGQLESLQAESRLAVQRIGIVRYNPFEDTGSNQSFALALLDGKADGIVLSSLHSRQQTRVFIKPIVGGRSETPLSEEESEALRKAGVR